jgi:BON domain
LRIIGAGAHSICVKRIILLVILSFAMTCAAMPSQTRAKEAAVRNGTGVSAKGDAAIEAAIKAKLAKSKIGADHFQVRVQGGVAIWEGRTDVVQHKGVATRMAKAAGARAVVNNIEIGEAAREKAGANLAKGRRRVQVKRGDPRSSK